MINRASGYVGSALGTYGENTAEGLISFTPPAVEMQPPNLKIKAKRHFEVQSGLSKAPGSTLPRQAPRAAPG